MFQFLPSTKRLFAALKFDWPDPDNEEQARDIYPIDAALTDWKNELYNQLSDDEYEMGTWPASPELLEAMRAALADQRGNYAGDELAYCLIRCGCRRAETIDGLSAWDAQLFRWSAAGFSAQDLFEKFKRIGVAGDPSAEDLDQLNGWLADPAAALPHYGSGNITGTVLKGRTIHASLYDNGGCLDYAELFKDMASHAEPPLPISNIRHMPLDDALVDVTARVQADMAGIIPEELKNTPIFEQPETFWKIAFSLDGVEEAIYVPGDFTWLNDAGVALHFDALLARFGRPERVLRFGHGRNESGSFWGHYIIAAPKPFASLCSELGIPLNDFTGTLRS